MKPSVKGSFKAKASSSHTTTHNTTAPIFTVSKSEIVEQRGKAISTRLGIQISTWEMRTTQPDETVLRQDKPVSLRLRWYCHRCNSDINSQGSCSNCAHVRCRICIRLPGDHDVDDDAVGMIPTQSRYQANDEGYHVPGSDRTAAGIVRQRRSNTGGHDLVLRKPRHRVRRTCHVCKTDFAQLGQTICDKCEHVRCSDCPRDPPKRSKYPFGYPGDVFGPNSIPYYECIKCWALYPPHTENGTPCRRCGEKKSDSSSRAQPRAVDPDYDPNFLLKLEAKLDALQAQGADPFLDP
ncbi:hypothetical protein CCM_04140 [Cordyceps militaris CM01]|uniref:Uncharacterized protein n=1 Tax=Cordyceps militaris (strain CM01) TaxID=983644 RepID=G3JDU2_CORMM|nr:uncharacterized protein CCM_04140 [Cordyceps militaris CM01]EGX92767.1 hypothetical protein CCM_04140 [Cordyceps militaris CM01]